MVCILSKVGTVSEWINLSDALQYYLRPNDESDDDKEDRLALCEKASLELADTKIKTKVLSWVEAEELREIESKATTRVDRHKTNYQSMKYGLVEIEGFDLEIVDDTTIEALSASGYGWLIGRVIRTYQMIKEEHRAGFFTRGLVA